MKKKTRTLRSRGTGARVLTRQDRLQSVIDLSNEFYWETDAQHRLRELLGRTTERDVSSRYTGMRRWEIGGEPVDGCSWDEHRRVLDARQPFRDFTYRVEDEQVGAVYLSVSGKPVFDGTGRFHGYRGITRNITVERRAAAHLLLENAIIRLLSGTDDIGVALTGSIRAICEAEGWDGGSFWKLDETAGVLRFAGGWCVPGQPAFAEFTERARTVTFRPGEGLPGAVLQSGEPLWVPDVTQDARLSETKVTELTGWHSVFLFPFHGDRGVAGVLDFYAPRIREPDARLLQIIRLLSTEIGHFYRRTLALDQLRDSEERYSSTFELAPVGIAHVGVNGRFLHVNQQLCRMLDYSEEQLMALDVWAVSHPDDVHVTDRFREQLRAGALGSFQCDKRYVRRDGSAMWAHLTVAARHDAAGNYLYDISILEDITARREAEYRLRESEARFRSLTELSSDWYWEQDANFRFTRFEGRDPEFIGELNRHFLGKPGWETGIDVGADDETYDMQALLNEHRPFRDVVMKRTMPDGSRRYSSVSGEPIFDIDGKFAGYRGLSRDITRSKEAEERIQHMATHDSLTDLPNRALFSQVLALAVQSAKRYARRFAVLFIDLDRIKQVNDTLGHAAGDELLKEMAGRLRGCIRSSDVCARLGGDEFIVLLPESGETGQVASIALNMLAAVSRPLTLAGEEIKVTASIGISLYPGDGEDGELLIRRADLAMYTAKSGGRNNYRFFSAAMEQDTAQAR